MQFLVAGLAGVVVGGVATAVLLLFLFQKRLDRDLVERQLRVCLEYQEAVAALVRVLEAPGQPGDVDQARWTWEQFRREFRLTSWVLRPQLQQQMERVIVDLQSEFDRLGDHAKPRLAQTVCERQRHLARLVDRERDALVSAFRRARYLPISSVSEPEHAAGAKVHDA